MVERIHWWTERSFECRTIHLSISSSIYLSSYPSYSVYLFICLSAYPFFSLSIHWLSSLSVDAAVHPTSYFLSMCPSVYLSFFLFLSFEIYSIPCLYVCLSTGLAVYPSISLSICSSSYPFYPFKYSSISPIHLCGVSPFYPDSSTASS